MRGTANNSFRNEVGVICMKNINFTSRPYMYFSEQGNVDDDATFITILLVSFNLQSCCPMQSAVCSLQMSYTAMRPFLRTIQTLQLSVRISLVDSTVRNNLCHPSFDSNVKYESNNITASSSRPYHAGILIFWSARTVIRKWSPCLPRKRDRWPAAEWKQYGAVVKSGWDTRRKIKIKPLRKTNVGVAQD